MTTQKLSDHFEELRKRLAIVLATMGGTFSLCWFFADSLVGLMVPEGSSLVLLSPLEGFFVTLKVAFWVGLTLASPVVLLQLLQFVLPALRPQERKLIWPLLFSILGSASLGCLIAYKWVIPQATAFFLSLNSDLGANLWSVDAYLDYLLTLILSSILLLQIVATLILLIYYQILTYPFLLRHRKKWWVGAFIVGAIITPPDVFSQVVAAAVLGLVYEGALLYLRLTQMRSRLS